MLLVLLLVTAVSASAQEVSYKIHKYNSNDGGILMSVTPNGKWAIVRLGTSSGGGTATPKLYNVETDEVFEVKFNDRLFSISAVSDDGNIVVGNFQNRIAILNRATNKITQVPFPKNWSEGGLTSITPDGKYAIGHLSGYVGPEITDPTINVNGLSGDYWFSTLFVDVEKGEVIETPNLPTGDRYGHNQNAIKFSAISPDGRYILGEREWYMPGEGFTFIYDTQKHDYTPIGFKRNGNRMEPISGIEYIDFPVMSPNGKYVGGAAIKVNESADSYATESKMPFRYDVETGELTLFEGSESASIEVGAIDNNGTIFGNPDNGSPLRDFRIFYKDKYWITMNQLCKQVYGFNFSEKTGYDRTGTATSVSGDGSRVVSFADPLGESYLFDFGMTIEEACDKVDLLDNYTATPANGSVFSQISSVEINFGRQVQVLGKGSTHVHLYKADGTKVADGMSSVSGLELKTGSQSIVKASFRTRALEDGVDYYVLIDEGAVAVANDPTRINKQIRIDYKGRKNGPVSLVKAVPENHSQLRQIDAASSYILLDFDCPIMSTEDAEAYIERVEDGARMATLTLAVGNTEATKRQVLLTATAETYLYDGLEYKVVISEGSLCDYSGLNESYNKKIELTYHGTYVREVSNDEVMFADDFNNMANSYATWMRYEGDHNTPLASMKAWGFDTDNYPWSFEISEDESFANPCAGSHSLYAPSAKSDDWMMTPQLIMPDDGKVVLEFDAQSYNPAKKDVLKVYVYEQDRNFSYLNSGIMDLVKKDAVLLDEITLTAGEQQEKLDGEWTHYRYDLSQWAGKNIYVAFANQNENQSAIFVDNVIVQRELLYTIGFSNADRVIAQDQIGIAGQFTVKSAEPVSSISLVLKDSENKEVDRIEWKNITGSVQNRALPFSFSKPLPLRVGEENNYTIEVSFGSVTDIFKGSIANLAFATTKRVVLEEMTGIDCINCPQGFLSIEKCEKTFGDQFIPVSIHTYTGDPYMGSLQPYTAFLGLNGAPSARINRIPGTYYPMVQSGGNYYLSKSDDPVWYDVVADELSKLTIADVNMKAVQSEDGKTIDYSVALRYALDAEGQQLSLFIVVLEDGLVNYQANGFHMVESDVFGQWANGGIYAADYAYPVVHNDVARSAVGQTLSGTIGLFPSTLKAGTTYTASLASAFPASIEDVHTASAVAMLIDTQTGQIVNAAKAKVTPNSTGIDDATTSSSETANIYSVSGTLIRANAPRSALSTLPAGIYIYGNKKISVK